jgi:hypothetical protein
MYAGGQRFTPQSKPQNYNLLFPAAFTLAHLALAAAARAARAAAENFFLAFAGLAAGALPLAAILFATPARMLASPWALIFLLAFRPGLTDGAVPLIFAHLAC